MGLGASGSKGRVPSLRFGGRGCVLAVWGSAFPDMGLEFQGSGFVLEHSSRILIMYASIKPGLLF